MGRVTLSTIAERTGLSKFAVSRALSGKSGVSDETRLMVEAVAREIGYHRGGGAQRPRTLGIVFDDTDAISSELNMQIQSGIRQEAERLGFNVTIHWTRDQGDLKRSAAMCDGFLVLGGRLSDLLVSDLGARSRTVYLAWLPPLERVDAVAATDHEAGAAVADYLFKLGHRRIAYVLGTPVYRGRVERMWGLQKRVEELHGMDCRNLTWEEGEGFPQALAALIASGAPMPTAFSCAHDGLAVTVVSELLTQGYRIPQDVSVVGFGDFTSARQIQPPLTTVRLPGVEMGTMMVRVLAERLSGTYERSFPIRVQVACELIERESAGAAPVPDATPAR